MPKEMLQKLADKAYVLGGWAMLPLCLVSTIGAFIAVGYRDYSSEFWLVLLAAWSGYEFCKFYERNKKT